MMKRVLTTLCLFVSIATFAQNENDSIVVSHNDSFRKEFGGFILDMSTILNVESLTLKPFFPTLNNLGTGLFTNDVMTVNPDAFKLNTDVTYFKASSFYPGTNFQLLSPFVDHGYQWHGASYRLKNDVRINIYGEYDKDGYRQRSSYVAPWQKNDFKAAFEMKSSNGNFGIKLEVQRGRNNPY